MRPRRRGDFDMDALLEFAREFDLQEWVAALMGGSWPHIIMTLMVVSVALRLGACLIPARKKRKKKPRRRRDTQNRVG